MLKRRELVQSPDYLRLAGKLAMMIIGQGQDVKIENYHGNYSAITEILSLNAIPLVHLYDNSYPGLASFFESADVVTKLQAERDRYILWKEAFTKVKDIFLKNSLDYLFIKTPSFLPYTSGNLDVLVKEQDFAKAGALLEEEGFIELKNIREPHKYLYKKFDAGEEIVPIHLHCRIIWLATFLDSKSVWSNVPGRVKDDVVFTLGAEDCLLTTLAHSFYENSAVRLLDLCIVKYLVENSQLDWHYISTAAQQHEWKEGFCIGLSIYSHLHQEIFGSQLFPQDVLKKAESYTGQKFILKRALQRVIQAKITMPFYLPLLLCKPLFYKKILRSREFGKYLRRMWILVKVLFESLFIILLKVNVQKPMLISVSGIDGSGKSSYAQALQKAFEGCGLKTSYIWTRVGSARGFQSMRKLWLRGSARSNSSTNSYDPAEHFSQTRDYLSRSWRVVLWQVANIVDFCLFYNLKVRMALLRRRVVICDRFIPDIFADLYTYSNDSRGKFWLKILSNCLPNPSVRLLLNVPPEVALERAKDKECSEYLGRQAELYGQIQRALDLNVVNTLGEFRDTCNRIINETLKTYYSKRCVVFGWDQDK